MARRVKGEGAGLSGYDFASISCRGSVFMKPEEAVKIAAGGVFTGSVSHCAPDFS